MFADRREAGEVLADHLARRLAGQPDAASTAPDADATVAGGALVCGLPRGGVPVAVPVAHRLRAPLDAILVRKLRTPGQPELAMGALAGLGSAVAEVAYDRVLAHLHIPAARLQEVVERERAALADLEVRYRGNRPVPDLTARAVVLVDDGLATGSTMMAAVRLARQLAASSVTVAVPVASRSAMRQLQREADQVVCVLVPDDFAAVSRYYRSFDAPSDEQVRAALRPHPT